MCSETGIVRCSCLELLVVFLCAMAPLPARAMTEAQLTMECPYDGVKFTFMTQMSGAVSDRTLDLKPVGMIQSPWPLAVCPSNGFVFLKEKYEPAELEKLRPLILSAEYQALKEETPYYRAAWIEERNGASREEVVNLLLQATWEAAEAETHKPVVSGTEKGEDQGGALPQGEGGARYRRYAGELLQRLSTPASGQGDARSQQQNESVLRGELLRRLGRFEEADKEFIAVAAMLDAAKQQKLIAIVGFERRLIAQRDSGIHLQSEAKSVPQ